MLEKIIAYHCGPALAGIKPGNLVTCRKDKFSNIKNEIKRLNDTLNCKDIFFSSVCECEKRVLLLVYRKKKLEEYLSEPKIKELLDEYGYGNCGIIEEYIGRLRKRFEQNGEFPHEIGAFLGYPINDIYGFINHKNDGCLFVGEWRVYDDAENARRVFDRYKCCRCALMRRILSGMTLAEIFHAA